MDLESLEWFGLGDLGVTSAQSLLEVTAPTNGFAGLGKGFGWFVLHSFYAKLTIQLLQKSQVFTLLHNVFNQLLERTKRLCFAKLPLPLLLLNRGKKRA